MADVSIPREAVDKAARAYVDELHNKLGWRPTFDGLTALEQHNARETATAMLNAAAPLIVAAELDRIAEGLTVHTTLKMPGVADRAGRFAQTAVDDVRTELRERAADLRAQS